jgi:hypothetical protein
MLSKGAWDPRSRRNRIRIHNTAYKYTCTLSNYHVDNVVETDPLFGNANFTPDLLIVFFGGIQFLCFSLITGVIKSVYKNAIEKNLLEILPGIKVEARCACSECKSLDRKVLYRDTRRLPTATTPFSLVLRKEYFDCPQGDSHAVHYI